MRNQNILSLEHVSIIVHFGAEQDIQTLEPWNGRYMYLHDGYRNQSASLGFYFFPLLDNHLVSSCVVEESENILPENLTFLKGTKLGFTLSL